MWAILAAALLLPCAAQPAPSEQASVVLVSAPWCAPCLEMKPGFVRSARAFEGCAHFSVLDADSERTRAQALGVESLPATLIRFHGRTVERDEGYLTPGEQWALGVRASLWPALALALGAAH